MLTNEAMNRRPRQGWTMAVRSGSLAAIMLALLPGAAFASADIDAAAAAYKQAAAADIDQVVAGAERLAALLEKGDVAAARRAWVAARVGWERSETFTATLFPDFDKTVDPWPDGKTGFHAIEAQLFAEPAGRPVDAAKALVEQLRLFRAAFAKADFTGATLIGGVAALAYEVGESKSQGGESRPSGTSLGDMQHNVEGLGRAWRSVFAPALAAKDARLAQRVEQDLARVEQQVSVAMLAAVDQPLLEKTAERLAGSIADAAVSLGYPAPDFAAE